MISMTHKSPRHLYSFLLLSQLVLVVAISPNAGAANRNTGPNAYRSPQIYFETFSSGICNFKLQGYEMTNPVKNAIVFGITKIYQTYTDTFEFKYSERFRVRVTIFNDKALFLEYQKAHLGKIISQGGYYTPTSNETVVYKGENTKEMLATLFHEASHMILRNQIPWVPTWINEGLSVYFEGLNVIGRKKRVVLDRNRYLWTKHWLKNGFPISLPAYLNFDNKDWSKFRDKNSNAAYTIGYSLVYFLMSAPKTETILKQLLWEFKLHGYRANSIRTINSNFPNGIANLERLWRIWIPKAKPSRPLKALRTPNPKNKGNL